MDRVYNQIPVNSEVSMLLLEINAKVLLAMLSLRTNISTQKKQVLIRRI
jgi:hypothetical protein